MTVQVARGLVRQQQSWVAHNCPGDCHPLLLSAGKLLGQMVDAFFQAHQFQRGHDVFTPLLLTRLNPQQRRDHVMTALKLVGLEERVNHLPKQLSGGQEQRVAIARAIVSDPTLLLADEPTGDLDSHSATEVLEILKRLNEDFHKTIVMVTHDPHAASYAHVTRHLEKGMLLPPG